MQAYVRLFALVVEKQTKMSLYTLIYAEEDDDKDEDEEEEDRRGAVSPATAAVATSFWLMYRFSLLQYSLAS